MKPTQVALWLIQCLAVDSALQVTTFISDLVHSQQWREIVVVQCTHYEPVSHWRALLGPTVYVRLMAGSMDTAQLTTAPVAPASLPVLVLPSCTPTNNLLMQVHINSNVNVVQFLSEHAIIWDLYRAGSSTALCLLPAAHWHSAGDKWRLKKPFKSLGSYSDKLRLRSWQLVGTVLRVGVLVAKPDYNYDCHVVVEEEQEQQIHLLSGFSVQLLNILQDVLQFKVVPVASDNWGFVDDEGVWTGLLGLLVNDVADLVLCHPTITVERSAVAQFLHPTLSSKLGGDEVAITGDGMICVLHCSSRVLVYRASSLPLTEDVLVLTFSGSLWLCLMLVLALLAISLHFSTKQNASLRSEQTPWTWIEVTLWVVSSICQQGSSQQPQGASCRAVFMVGYLSMYLLYTGFAAGVTSLLAIQGQDTHLQLADVRHMCAAFAAYWDGLQRDFFQTSNDTATQALYASELRKERNQLYSLDELFSRLHEDRSITMATRQPVQHYMGTRMNTEEACQLTVSTISGSRHYKALAVRNKSPYNDILNHWLLRIREAGLLHLAATRNISPPPSCGSGPGYSSASIDNVASAVAIFSAGLAIACLLVLAEKAWHRHKREHRWMERTRQDVLLQLQKNTSRHNVVAAAQDSLHLRIQSR